MIMLRVLLEVGPELAEVSHLAPLVGVALERAESARAVGRGGRLVCVVVDTGIGVCADDVPFLCDDFYQVDAHDSNTYAVAGLGLAVAKGLIELMEGTIGFRSEPGHGTRVIFEVPVEVT